MAEDTKAKSPVNDTQGSSMPSDSETTQKTTVQPAEAGKQDGLPENASDRTKNEFDKIRSELREERTRREQLEASFRSISQKPKEPDPIYDPTTGLIDGQQLTALQKKTYEAEQRALQAEQRVSSYMKQREESDAYQSHPWLNPDPRNKEFDQEKYNLATGIALASMVHPDKFGGKQLDLKGAGDYVAKLTSLQVEKVKKDAAKEAIEQLSPKEQAALEATGNAGRRTEADSSMDYEQVRNVTRKGGTDGLTATMARLRALKTQAQT